MSLKRLLIISFLTFIVNQQASGIASRAPVMSKHHNSISINTGWKFHKDCISDAQKVQLNDASWEAVVLPHTPNLEPMIVNDQWMGICWYRKMLNISEQQASGKVFIEFEGAMNHAQVWINGKKAADHHGGYLPIVIDATDYVQAGNNLIAVRLDNTDNPVTGPKPHVKTDFCKYGGLYRNATVTFKDKIYISHPLLAEKTAGGGTFITTPVVSKEKSTIQVQTHLVNEFKNARRVTLRQTVFFEGSIISSQESQVELSANADKEVLVQFEVKNAKLWSPTTPNLYHLKSEVLVDGQIVDSQTDRIGVREFIFKDNQLYINGKKTFLRGVNRHQEYPFAGYAISDQANVRDAKLIKKGGFDLIRLSHYPQSPAFMDACDELGLVVLDAILGWQYYSEDPAFNEYCFRSAQNLVRRDRNHPCVLAWEVSLNETTMPVPFMQKLHDIVHAEYPSKTTYTCGWMPEVYDIFVQARQHRILHGTDHMTEKPFLVSEYGDWEYYSRNAGLNQDQLDKTARKEQSSRQLRGYGEARLKQQAFNVQEAHNDNRATPAIGDAYWDMFDYNSGCHDELCCCGLMDLFRLPKSAYWFYQSQKEVDAGVVLNISSYWNEQSPLDIKVYSNCDEVELFVNGKSAGRQKPDGGTINTHLKHPPFTFNLKAFEAGDLKVIGFIAGKSVDETIVKTPGQAVALKLWVDDAGVQPTVNDTVFIRIAAVDANGTIVPDFDHRIDLTANVTLLNVGEIRAEAGIATALIKTGSKAGKIKLSARADELKGTLKLRIEAK